MTFFRLDHWLEKNRYYLLQVFQSNICLILLSCGTDAVSAQEFPPRNAKTREKWKVLIIFNPSPLKYTNIKSELPGKSHFETVLDVTNLILLDIWTRRYLFSHIPENQENLTWNTSSFNLNAKNHELPEIRESYKLHIQNREEILHILATLKSQKYSSDRF